MTPSLVAAMEAQIRGFGGCPSEVEFATVDIEFFPKVTFHEGSCRLEHGGVATPLAASDSDRRVFAFGSDVSYRFFVGLHPPVGVDQENAIAFVRVALRLMGALPDNAMILREPQDLTPALSRKFGITPEQIRFTRVMDSDGGLHIAISAVTNAALQEYTLVLYPLTGYVNVITRERYAALNESR